MAVRTLEANANIGYLHTYKTPTKTKTATVAFGYADGYPLGASNKGVVLINGQRCPVLGRVSMDYITIDVSNVKNEIKSGDDCVLLGKQGEEEIFLEEWASWKNSIVYDITCSFGRRVCKQYTNS